MKAWAAGNATTATTGPETLSYGGGVSGVGVLSGHSQVYLVVYGNQWGNQSTDANGNLTFSNDAYGAAAAAQMMFKGIGTNNELWSADLTQWCDGAGVATGATSCPASGVNMVPYQSGGVLAGVWYDNSVASPASATGNDLANEAIKAAAHFGNTTAASNRNTYYVILSPHGTNPDNYQSPTQGYCAWHDYTGDSSLSGGAANSPYGLIAFSNQPYNMDQGSSCGVGFVNGTAGNLDGWTMTLGHEWHEMMSDMFPAGGWTNHTGNATYNGMENSDECAWINPGQPGGAANITFATGTFAEQASWSNDTNSCAISHAIVSGSGTPTANFSYTTSGLTANFTDTSTDSGGTIGSHSWTFGDGATSTAANPSHTYAAAGSYSVSETVTDAVSGTTSSKTVTLTVTIGGGTPSANFSFTTSGLTANFTDTSTDSGGTIGSHSWTFGDGGTSTAANPSHTYAAAGTYSVTETVTDSANGSSSSKTSSVSVTGGGGSTQLLGNTGFESGSASPWTMSSGVLCSNSSCGGETAHAGSWFAWLDGYGTTHTDTVSQSVTIPSGKTTATLQFYLHIDTAETTTTTAYDTLKVQVLNSSGTVLATLATFSNLNAASGYTVHTANMSAYIGQTVTIKFTGSEDASLQTSFVLDDVTLTAQ